MIPVPLSDDLFSLSSTLMPLIISAIAGSVKLNGESVYSLSNCLSLPSLSFNGERWVTSPDCPSLSFRTLKIGEPGFERAGLFKPLRLALFNVLRLSLPVVERSVREKGLFLTLERHYSYVRSLR